MDKQRVLEIVREKGPVLPRDVVREVGGDTMLTGAVLSQLVDSKQIRISHTKVGGSPVYYVDSQRENLQELKKFLKDMEKKAFEELKESKIIRDSQARPALRVALRNIRDFAYPLEVHIKDSREIFWKWYLLDNSEAEKKIREIIRKEYGQPEQRSQPEKKEEEKKVEKTEPEEKPPKEKEKKEEEPKEEEKSEELAKKKEKQTQFEDDDEEEEEEDHELLSKIKSVFEDKNIQILEHETIRKNSDIEMIVKIPSAVGKLKYFCKIRDKKRCSDKDISAAYVQGNMKKLPVLFVATGDMTKKAKEMLDKEFKMIALLQI